MQKFLIVVIVFISQVCQSQTAVNFTCNDCFGVNHDLFAELDAGKVIVICWVEPCGGCADASLISSTLVESFQENYPDKVYMYLADDYADTDCASLISWANMFGIHPTTFFSDSSVDMFDYGEPGMPKVIVVADLNHHVYYNANYIVDPAALEEAIYNAISATVTGIDGVLDGLSEVQIFPNPAEETVTISFHLEAPSELQFEIFNYAGQVVFTKVLKDLSSGLNTIEADITSFENGIYIFRLTGRIKYNMAKLVVIH